VFLLEESVNIADFEWELCFFCKENLQQKRTKRHKKLSIISF